ncbi:hypothetical protein FRC17_008047 [Serendipita sp. 399]|nr:hypothetical protein FRC17_008047 [Serendipita sp. 399]
MATGAYQPAMFTGMSGAPLVTSPALPNSNPVWQDMAAIQTGPALPTLGPSLNPGLAYGATAFPSTLPIANTMTGWSNPAPLTVTPMMGGAVSAPTGSPYPAMSAPYLQSPSINPTQPQYVQPQPMYAAQQPQLQLQQPLYVQNGVIMQQAPLMQPPPIQNTNPVLWNQGGVYGAGVQGQWQVTVAVVLVKVFDLRPFLVFTQDLGQGALRFFQELKMDQQLFNHVYELLKKITVPDTAIVKEATAQLQQVLSNSESIPVLFELSVVSPEWVIRQLAAVELRKQIGSEESSPWLQVPVEHRTAIKDKILQHLLVETESIVRHSFARVISAIAAVELPHGQWPQLLPFVQGICEAQSPVHRESGAFILFTILEVVVEGMQDRVGDFLRIFNNLLRDPQSVEVRLVTLRALGTLAGYIDIDDKVEIKAFQTFIPQMFAVLGESLTLDNDEGARHGFDTLSTLLIMETPLLSKHVRDVVTFCVQAGSNTELDEEVRIMALNALVMTIKYKKTKIHNLQLAPHLVDALMPLLMERDTDDEDEETPARLGVRALDALATSLPPQQVFPRLHELVTQYSQDVDPNRRKAALMALGVVMEGCSEFIRPYMNQVWPFVDNGLKDPEASVRKAACTAVGCITEWLDEECAERHAVLVPALLQLTSDPVTQASACTALDGLLELLGDDIESYLPLLMTTFTQLLGTAPNKVRAVVIGAIGSTAHASKEKFLPYFKESILQLVPFLKMTGEGEEEELRGIAMDACGTFAEAVPKEEFLPFYEDLMGNAYQSVQSQSSRLRECSFLFFGVMAGMFPEKFIPYLPNVIPAFLQTLKLDELGDSATFIETKGQGDSSETPIQIIENKIEEIEDMDPEALLKVNSAIAIEKEIAADVIGGIFANTREHFLPYLEDTALVLQGLVSHYYEGIRKSAIQSIFTFIATLHELSNPQPWVAGAHNVVPLNENVAKLISHTMPEILEAFDMEDDKGVSAAICQALADATTKVGPALIKESFDPISAMCLKILSGKSMAQVDPDQGEEEESAEELAEMDSVLIGACEDLVSSLASVLGPDFAVPFEKFLPLIAQYYGPKRAAGDRSSAIGSFGEIITGMKGGITPYTDQIRLILMQAVQDPEAEVKSNAAFALGVLIENTDYVWSKEDFEGFLFRLRPYFQIGEGASKAEFNARDNAAGAVSRMILTNPALVPLESVLPVLFGALPLQHDPLENRPLFRAIFALFQSNPNYSLAYIDQLLPVFTRVLDPNARDEIGDENRANLIALLGQINTLVPGKLQASPLAAFL